MVKISFVSMIASIACMGAFVVYGLPLSVGIGACVLGFVACVFACL